MFKKCYHNLRTSGLFNLMLQNINLMSFIQEVQKIKHVKEFKKLTYVSYGRNRDYIS